ncbi:MAG: TrkH family potassium uptake protein [Candidatus Aminicenantes bacterium]|nr:MAG: TrkH family potassium uptake protein [Candidatus Aminicenantes bacterium]
MTRTLNIRSVLHVLGFMVFILGLMMLIPLGISLLYQDGSSAGILVALLVTSASGGLIYLFFKQEKELGLRDGFLIVGLGWFLMAWFGSLPYFFSGAIPSFTDCFFEAMSGFTTTGASILNDIEQMPAALLFWRAFTHWIGGMGIIVLSLAILPLLGVGGMQLFKAEVPGPTADKLTPRIAETARILWLVYVGITLLEVIFLLFGGMSLLDAFCHAFATMATGGFSTRNASIGAFNSTYFDYVIIFFMFAAGTNFALHYKFIMRKFNAYWKNFEFKTYLGILFIAAAAITLSNLLGGIYNNLSDSLRYGLFQAVSIGTTTGFCTADYETWTPLAQILLFILMFIGGSAGSTGGAMKVVRLIIVVKHTFIELKKLIHPQAVIPLRVGNQVIPKEVTLSVIGFFLLYVLLFVIISIVMTFMGMDLLTAAGASASCLGNIGPGLGNVGPADNFAWMPIPAKWILAITMMVGRLEIYTVLVIFTKGLWAK